MDMAIVIDIIREGLLRHRHGAHMQRRHTKTRCVCAPVEAGGGERNRKIIVESKAEQRAAKAKLRGAVVKNHEYHKEPPLPPSALPRAFPP